MFSLMQRKEFHVLDRFTLLLEAKGHIHEIVFINKYREDCFSNLLRTYLIVEWISERLISLKQVRFCLKPENTSTVQHTKCDWLQSTGSQSWAQLTD